MIDICKIFIYFQIFDITKLAESPTFGKPSYDSHVLRDDFASEDRPLITRYVDTPLKKSGESCMQ